MSSTKSRRQRRIKEKLSCNYGELIFENQKYLIVDHDPLTESQKKDIHLGIESLTGKSTKNALIDWIIEDGSLFVFVDIDGELGKVHTPWFNKKIRVLKQLKNYRTSANNNTLYRREVTDFRFKKGLLIHQRTFIQEFPYRRTGLPLKRPLMPYIRE